MESRVARLDKYRFLQSIECLARGWFLRHGSSETAEQGVAEKLRSDEGRHIGEVARGLFPRGVLVHERESAAAAKRTAELLRDRDTRAIFEGAFIVGDLVARPDILRRGEGGWDLIEVKSSLEPNDGDAPKAELIEDLAYTLMVLRACGLQPNRAVLLLLRRDYRHGMPHSSLLREIDCTKAAAQLAAQFEALTPAIAAATSAPKPPMARMCKACRSCEYFGGPCIGENLGHPVFELPRLSVSKLDALVESGVLCIADVPEDFELTDNQGVVRAAVLSGKPDIDLVGLRSMLSEVRWPAHYLDFETLMTALPLYPGFAPHQQIPTQYSLHVCDRLGNVTGHREYLADPARDCRRELADRLVADLAGDGSIVVYSPFERRVLGDLTGLFPELASQLLTIIDRLFDLEPALRPGSYYHPEFHGSSSIKRTLPVLVPDLSYDGLAIADGDTAQALFARLARGDPVPMSTEEIQSALLAYCKLDTLAMVRIHEALARECGLVG